MVSVNPLGDLLYLTATLTTKRLILIDEPQDKKDLKRFLNQYGHALSDQYLLTYKGKKACVYFDGFFLVVEPATETFISQVKAKYHLTLNRS